MTREPSPEQRVVRKNAQMRRRSKPGTDDLQQKYSKQNDTHKIQLSSQVMVQIRLCLFKCMSVTDALHIFRNQGALLCLRKFVINLMEG